MGVFANLFFSARTCARWLMCGCVCLFWVHSGTHCQKKNGPITLKRLSNWGGSTEWSILGGAAETTVWGSSPLTHHYVSFAPPSHPCVSCFCVQGKKLSRGRGSALPWLSTDNRPSDHRRQRPPRRRFRRFIHQRGWCNRWPFHLITCNQHTSLIPLCKTHSPRIPSQPPHMFHIPPQTCRLQTHTVFPDENKARQPVVIRTWPHLK